MEPVSGIALASLGLQVLGSGVSIAGQMKQTYDSQVSANYQARQASENITLMRVQERLWQKQHKEEGEQLLGEQAAAYGKAGVQMSGSPLLMMTHTAGKIERDAYLKSRETEINISKQKQQIALTLQSGQDAATAGALNIAGEGLSLLSNLSSSDYIQNLFKETPKTETKLPTVVQGGKIIKWW